MPVRMALILWMEKILHLGWFFAYKKDVSPPSTGGFLPQVSIHSQLGFDHPWRRLADPGMLLEPPWRQRRRPRWAPRNFCVDRKDDGH